MCAFLVVVTNLGEKSCSEHAGEDNINKIQTPGGG